MIPKQLQYSYKKVIGFTEEQHKSLLIIESYNVNVNRFIRSAIKEKLKRDWPKIKAEKERFKFQF
jgi:hypothetical protein